MKIKFCLLKIWKLQIMLYFPLTSTALTYFLCRNNTVIALASLHQGVNTELNIN